MTKINATNRELVDLLHSLYAVQELKGVRFAVAVSKNINTLKEELEHLEAAGAPTPEFNELMVKAQVLMDAQDEEGVKKLEEDNQEIVEARKAQLAELEEMMKDATSCELQTISEESLPADITAKQLNGIIKILE